MNILFNDRIFKTVSEVCERGGVDAYVIGGYVRDYLLNRDYKGKDIDIVVIGDGVETAKLVAKAIRPGVKVSVFRTFGTAMFRVDDCDIEFVGARKESYNRDSRKPKVESGTLEDDQNRRDFTINALAVSLNKQSYGELLDPFGGMSDLKEKILRTPLDPDITFSDDPLRMMRAIRFSAQLGFEIHPETFASIVRNADRIKIVSAERISIELNKILSSGRPSQGLLMLEESGLLEKFFPELIKLKGVEEKEGKGHKDNFHHTLKVVENISQKSDNLWLRWAALLHDIAKPATKKFIPGTGWSFHGHDFIGAKMVPQIFSRLKLPQNEKMKYIQKLVGLHLRPIALVQEEVTDAAVRRLLFEAGEDIDDLMLLCQADITSGNRLKVKKHLENFELVRLKMVEIEEKDAVRNFQPPVSGDEIIAAFGLKPCHLVGEIKGAIKDAILDGLIPNEREAAWNFMLNKGKELGLTFAG
jgi:poly(A) polymerase